MAEVKFYHNAPDRLTAVCAIAGKAVRQGRRVVVYATEPAVSQRLDALLWSIPAGSFVPHVPQASPLATRTPVILSHQLGGAPHRDVLINLHDGLPEGYEAFETIVEVVPQDEQVRQSARERWQTYKSRGFIPQAFDLAKAE